MKSANLNFQDRRWNYPYKGFTSIINQIVEIAKTHYEFYGNFCVHIDDQQIDQFFDVKIPFNTGGYDVSSWWLNLYQENKIYHPHDSHHVANEDDLKAKKKTFEEILNLKKEFRTNFEENFQGLNLKDCLGIQIRGTDKSLEIPRINEEKILKKIDSYIDNNKMSYNKILLCTDDTDYAKSVTQFYGEQFVIQQKNVFRSSGIQSVHHNVLLNRGQINLQVLWDVYALSQTKSMMYTFSNVSHLALCLGSGIHQQVKCLSID